jgi:hypothetical protein
MKDIEIRVHKLPILRLERDRLFPLGISPERLAQVDVSILEMPDPVGGVEVESRVEVPVVQLFQEVSRIREESLAPGITCEPAETVNRSIEIDGRVM